MQTIAILLTVFNRKEKTLKCLGNLYRQRPVKEARIDVYLTDDGCTDGTPEAVAVQYPQVHIIKGNGSLFWNRGMYTAWEAAARTKDYDYYLWLNDDTFVYPDMLSILVQASREKADKAIIVGATQSADHRQATYGGRLANGKIPVPEGHLTAISCFNGNIVLVARYVFRQLGNLDYYFTHSKGDFDYGMRAREAGIQMFQAGKFLGECELHESLDKWCNPAIPFKQRWKMLHRPNGMPPKETFYLERKHIGIIPAVFHYITVHMRCIAPWLWLIK